MNVTIARERLGFSKADLAKKIGVLPQFVSAIEKPIGVAGRRPPSPRVVTALYLLGGLTADEALAICARLPIVKKVEEGRLDRETAWDLNV